MESRCFDCKLPLLNKSWPSVYMYDVRAFDTVKMCPLRLCVQQRTLFYSQYVAAGNLEMQLDLGDFKSLPLS